MCLRMKGSGLWSRRLSARICLGPSRNGCKRIESETANRGEEPSICFRACSSAPAVTMLTTHLESQFDLTPNQSKRLGQLKYLLLHSEEAGNTVSTVLKTRLPREHRLLVGKFLVGIAAADQIVTRDEVKALRAAYRALGLEPGELDELLAAHVPSDAEVPASTAGEPEPQQFHLDMEAISSIMAETKEVASLLYRVMAEDDGGFEAVHEASSEPSTETAWQAASDAMTATAVLEPDAALPEQAVEPSPSCFDGLPSRFQAFLRSLVARDRWTREEAAALAREHKVMLAGAVEAINEWSCGQFGDWLVEEEDDGLVVQTGLIEGGM